MQVVDDDAQLLTKLVDAGCLPKQVVDILHSAFHTHGYVAGGFARLLAGYHTRTRFKTFDELALAVHGHLRMPNPHKGGFRPLGDIDVFFEDAYWRDVFLDGLKRSNNVDLFESVSGNACDLRVDGYYRIQFIKNYMGNIEEQLNSFDLVNSMVGFDGNRLVMHDDWQVLESSRTLDIDKITSMYILCRVAKYFHRHGYDRLTPRASERLTKLVFEELPNVRKTDQAIISKRMNLHMSYRDTLNKLFHVIPGLRSEDLLLISTLYYKERYNLPMKELLGRSKM